MHKTALSVAWLLKGQRVGAFVLVLAFVATIANAQSMRQQLLQRLETLQQKGIMLGHQDDTFYGTEWKYEDGRSDIKEVCGDYPAVMGFELGGIEMGDRCNLDSVPFTEIVKALHEHIHRGGIATVSWHPRNPLTGGNAWDAKDTTVVASILPGGSQHLKFLGWMKKLSAFLKQLSYDKDQCLSFVFRPWHENNGTWFWWGEKQCTAKEYHALWCMLQDYLLSEGFTNLVWSYSPNLWPNMTERAFLVRYPGNDRVDVIGLDAYQWGSREEYISQASHDLDVLCRYSADHKKLFALTECGMQSVPDNKWWTETLLPVIKGRQLSYILPWRNGNMKERFAPYHGSNDSKDFLKFLKQAQILTLKDIK